MFRDKRLNHRYQDLYAKLILENSSLKKTIENLRREIMVKENSLAQWENYAQRMKEEKERLERENFELQMRAQIEKILSSLQPFSLPTPSPSERTLDSTGPYVLTQEPDPIKEKWIKILKLPSRCLIIGKSGSGKSALAHFLLETFHYHKRVYILNFPGDKIKYLPPYMNVVRDIKEVLPDSLCLIDEAFLEYDSKGISLSKEKRLSEILNLFRHRKISLIFVAQNTRLINIKILFMVDYLIFKEVTDIQVEMERKEIKRYFREAKHRFSLIRGDKRKFCYLISSTGDAEEILENELPSYWNEEISTAYQSISTPGERMGKEITREEKKRIAQKLRLQGYSYRTIARFLGISKSTAINWLKK